VFKVVSTYKVLADRAMSHDSGEDWVDWAIEMVGNGYESEHLYILAGLTSPYNIFEVDEIASKALKELGIERPAENDAINGYAYFLMSETLSSRQYYGEVLRILKDICIARDYYDPLYKFYLLFFAYDDLKEQNEQYYWQGADKSNIEAVVKSEFQTWMGKFERGEYNSA
jgi:hypothetical protein